MNYHSCRQAAAIGTNKFLDQGSNIQNKHLLKNFKKYLVPVLQFFALFRFSQGWEGYFSYLNTSKVVYANRWQTDWQDLGIIKDELSKNILESLNIDFLENEELELPE